MIGKIIKNISLSFAMHCLQFLLFPQSIIKWSKKRGINIKTNTNVLFQTLKNVTIIITTQKTWQHTILLHNGNVIMEKIFKMKIN
ncbi:hypothetical protein D6923_01715 [Escherichia coli]|nr:hypothetical protein [Escherichia coli]